MPPLEVLAPATPRPRPRARPGRTKRFLRIVRTNPVTAGGTVVVLFVLLTTVVGPFLLAYAPDAVDPARRLAAPSLAHPFGTDQFGRDVVSRVVDGARVSLFIGFAGTALAMLLGMVIGLAGAYVGGWLDEVAMRVMDVIMAFPYIVLAIALAWVVGPSIPTLIIVVGVIRLPQFARVIRATALSVRERDYVLAARSLGQGHVGTVMRHVLPNAISPVIVFATLSVATAINTEAALSFLGVGVQPPTASWGNMLSDGRRYVFDAVWIATFPGLAISLTIFGFNLLGDGLRDALDPTMRNLSGGGDR